MLEVTDSIKSEKLLKEAGLLLKDRKEGVGHQLKRIKSLLNHLN
jgi:hypothetical protein